MPAQLSYKTLREENSAEFIINKSRFIGYGCPCETEEEALAFLARIRQKHKDATHNCYAYIIGLNSGIMRYSDDGEPSGTAGMPIIEVMKARGVSTAPSWSRGISAAFCSARAGSSAPMRRAAKPRSTRQAWS